MMQSKQTHTTSQRSVAPAIACSLNVRQLSRNGAGARNGAACRLAVMFLVAIAFMGGDRWLLAQAAIKPAITQARQKVVKVYGAGGLRGLEAYQSGFLVSPEGHIATAWSYVLDVDPVVILDDGRRFEAEVVGFEAQLELAVLKIPASGTPFFSVRDTPEPVVGMPVLAISNLFNIAAGNEPASVMQGYVAGLTQLDARQGVFQSVYRGDVLVLDLVANNPGAAGGALVDRQGRLLGMLGKELRDGRSGAWLNYALPVGELRNRLMAIVSGEIAEAPPMEKELRADQAHNLATLGLQMVPNVLDKTPAYIDAVQAGSPAAAAGLIPDDLILLVDGVRIDNQATLLNQLQKIDRRDRVSMLVQRGTELLSVQLTP